MQTAVGFTATGVQFDAEADFSTLRELRWDALQANANAIFVLVTNDSNLYSLYVRDDLPSAQAEAVRTFLDQASTRF